MFDTKERSIFKEFGMVGILDFLQRSAIHFSPVSWGPSASLLAAGSLGLCYNVRDIRFAMRVAEYIFLRISKVDEVSGLPYLQKDTLDISLPQKIRHAACECVAVPSDLVLRLCSKNFMMSIAM